MKSNNWNLIWNPFTRVAGWQAFWVGMVIVVASAVLASYGNLLFDGAIDAHFGNDVGIVQSLAVTGISLLSVVVRCTWPRFSSPRASVSSISLGTMTLGMSPFLLLAIISPFVSYPTVDQLLQDPVVLLSILSLAVHIDFITGHCMVHCLDVQWFRSTGAKGTKLVIAFIVALLSAEVVSKVCIHFLPLNIFSPRHSSSELVLCSFGLTK